jgi:Archaeal/vacuolar-type H+-ATPase subunit E
MAGIENLTEKILNDAEERKQKIIKDAEKDAEIYIKQQQLAADTKYQKNITQYENELRNKLQNQVSKQHIITRNSLLKTKQELIEKVYDVALKQLQEITKEQFLQFVEQIITNSGFVGDVALQLGENSKNILTTTELETITKKYVPEKTITISSAFASNQSGIILSQDGVEINYTFEAILRTLKDEIGAQLVEILFGE